MVAMIDARAFFDSNGAFSLSWRPTWSCRSMPAEVHAEADAGQFVAMREIGIGRGLPQAG